MSEFWLRITCTDDKAGTDHGVVPVGLHAGRWVFADGAYATHAYFYVSGELDDNAPGYTEFERMVLDRCPDMDDKPDGTRVEFDCHGSHFIIERATLDNDGCEIEGGEP